MELKSMIHTITWMVADGMAAVWVLHMLSDIMLGKNLMQTLFLLSNTLCG